MSRSWTFVQLRGRVAELHERSARALSSAGDGEALSRSVFAMEPSDRALVLGSSQPATVGDALACEREGVSLVRRRSGGGAVLVEPGGQLWVDVVLPAGDPLWEADVGRAAWWLGRAWARALASVGWAGASVWTGPFTRRPRGDLCCFATLAGGEVTWAGRQFAGAGPKVVGISQRRARLGALFQCACLLRWEPALLVRLLGLQADERDRAVWDLAGVACPVGASSTALLKALLAALPG